MASSSVTYRLTESYLNDLLDSVDWSLDPGNPNITAIREEIIRVLMAAMYDREFKPWTRAGEVIVLTFQLDPNGAEQPEDG